VPYPALPASQLSHSVFLVVVQAKEMYLPAPHVSQVEQYPCPADEVYFPLVHVSQDVALDVEYLPASQLTQL
jgi:hypothetical protein